MEVGFTAEAENANSRWWTHLAIRLLHLVIFLRRRNAAKEGGFGSVLSRLQSARHVVPILVRWAAAA